MKNSKFLNISFFLLLSGVQEINAQTVEIEFPKFAGKTYEFIIFQGSKEVKVHDNDTIPQNGVVKIDIPVAYAPYTGMCRWLITNTAEGGGIDMAIPGHGFKVSCLSDKPDEGNIKYIGFDAVNELIRLNRNQQAIINKFETMSKAMQLYDKHHPLYDSFENEKAVQVAAYDNFHNQLKQNVSYNARFLPIANLLNGKSPKLTDNYEQKAKFVNEFIVNELNYNHLYTSSHWTSIIQIWVQMHAQMFTNKEEFVQDFNSISDRIIDPIKYTDFVGKVTYFLSLYVKDDFIEAIASTVIKSGKINSYEGKTMQVYVTAMIGTHAPDVFITEHIDNVADHKPVVKVLPSIDFSTEGFNKTLLVFYESTCGACEVLMQQLPSNYDTLKNKGIDVIAISSDTSEEVFKNTLQKFPWQRTFCDFKGRDGQNFKNYAVLGTPTIYLIDKTGKIEAKLATMQEILAWIK